MKRYHEAAVIKKGNERIGFIMEDHAIDIPLNKNYLRDWQIIDKSTFTDLVKNGDVAYLSFKDGRVVCDYTEEEINHLNKGMKIPLDYIKATESNYWEMDLTFKASHIAAAQQCPNCVAIAMGETVKIFGITSVLLYAYGGRDTLRMLFNGVSDGLMAYNNVACKGVIPVKVIDRLFNDFISRQGLPLVCTSTAKWVLHNNMRLKKGIVIGRAKEGNIESLIKELDKVTADSERVLGI